MKLYIFKKNHHFEDFYFLTFEINELTLAYFKRFP